MFLKQLFTTFNSANLWILALAYKIMKQKK